MFFGVYSRIWLVLVIEYI